MSHYLYEEFHSQLEKRKSKNLFRTLQLPGGIDFSSNDYLGLSIEPRILEALEEGIRLYGGGSTASRLIRGHRKAYEELEDEFSRLTNGEAALFVANGFTANMGLMDAIANRKTIVFCDRLNHASLLDGIRMSGAKRVYYNHLDMNDLGEKLEKHKNSPQKILVSETVFSMDGDILPIHDYVKLAEEYDAILVLDETHAVGVFGENGGGISCDPGHLDPMDISRIDFRVYTMGKALGLEGGIIVFREKISKDYFINGMRNFVFSTAPLPAIAHAGLTALDILKQEPSRREQVLNNIRWFRKSLQAKTTNHFSSQIIPWILSSEEEALTVSKLLQKKGMDIRAIRPPTVPSPRLRISIHSHHTHKELEDLAGALDEILLPLRTY